MEHTKEAGGVLDTQAGPVLEAGGVLDSGRRLAAEKRDEAVRGGGRRTG